jgi:hypothetical protein
MKIWQRDCVGYNKGLSWAQAWPIVADRMTFKLITSQEVAQIAGLRLVERVYAGQIFRPPPLGVMVFIYEMSCAESGGNCAAPTFSIT